MTDRRPTEDPVVYVPAADHTATASIAPGSGIVGRLDAGEMTEIYFEGAIYEQANIVTLADRVRHAYGRLEENYPTVAKMVVPRDALVPVGVFLRAEGRIELTGPASEEQVRLWLGAGGGPRQTLDRGELLCGGHAGAGSPPTWDFARPDDDKG